MQTGVSRRFDSNYMFSVFYVWSKALTSNGADYANGYPFSTDKDTIKHYDWSYTDYDRPHNFVANAIYRLPKFTENRAAGILVNEWQLSGDLPLDQRPARTASASASPATAAST